ncbi:alpha/beta fold hydrolase [Lactobacillus sp. DCY120]|uniref:Alpha/beta fold hydrolase n=1 Tax=Bombilactobacillus apium TaxID=2675299 RepID=A0A850R1S5_9LACO|nr:alpha/beta fold hydrolase [Bombilactobacillus apium]NVY97069.1 alpha/beta fold hydrolase [Bombilactobacillus apium]
MKVVKPESLFWNRGPQAVILLHSYTGTPNDMRALARNLAKANYSVYAPLFRGHGTENVVDILKEGNPARWQEDMEAALSFVQSQGKTPRAIFGLSLGAIFATRALVKHPELQCGGVFGSPLFTTDFTNVRAGFYQYLTWIGHYYQIPETEQEGQRQVVDQLLPQALEAIYQAQQETTSQLTQLQQPYFIGHGQDDVMVPVKAAEKVRQQLPVQQVDFRLYPQAGHVITVNQAREQLISDVLNFLTMHVGV